MINVDEIMDMLDWNNSLEMQRKGVELAKGIKCINVFLQPMHKEHNKNVWNNCAIILSERTDEELAPYLLHLFSWIKDLNWPGAYCILNRLNEFKRDSMFCFAYQESVKAAKKLDDEIWLEVLFELVHN